VSVCPVYCVPDLITILSRCYLFSPPPSYFKANPPLGQFVHKQRQLYRQYKSKKGDESCYLKSFQVKLLEDIGFACRKKPGVLWMAQFSLLKKFEEEHGHVHVPMHYKKDKRLGHWVNVSRFFRRNCTMNE